MRRTTKQIATDNELAIKEIRKACKINNEHLYHKVDDKVIVLVCKKYDLKPKLIKAIMGFRASEQ